MILDTDDLKKLNQEDIRHLGISIKNSDIGTIIRSFLTKKRWIY
jgi:hypothetical protein